MGTIRTRGWLFVITAFAAICLVACSGEVTQPQPQVNDYHVYFYYTEDSSGVYMPVYSTAGLEVVDSVFMGADSNYLTLDDMEFFGGDYVVALTRAPSAIVVAQLPSFDTVAQKPVVRSSLVLSHSHDLVATDGNSSRGPQVYELPSLELVWHDTTRNGERAVFSPDDKQLVVCGSQSSSFRIVNFRDTPVTTKEVPTTSADGTEDFLPWRLAVDTANEKLYALGWIGDLAELRAELHVYRFDPFEYEQGLGVAWGFVNDAFEVSPDGRYVYLCSGAYPREVARYSATTGMLSTFLTASDIGLDTFQPFDMELTPDGKLLAIMSTPRDTGYFFTFGPGDIFIVDTGNKDVRTEFLNNGGIGQSIWCRP